MVESHEPGNQESVQLSHGLVPTTATGAKGHVCSLRNRDRRSTSSSEHGTTPQELDEIILVSSAYGECSDIISSSEFSRKEHLERFASYATPREHSLFAEANAIAAHVVPWLSMLISDRGQDASESYLYSKSGCVWSGPRSTILIVTPAPVTPEAHTGSTLIKSYAHWLGSYKGSEMDSYLLSQPLLLTHAE